MTVLLSKRWIAATLLVIAAALIMARLGLWQLDRLEQRRELNARVAEQINLPPLDLNAALLSDAGIDLSSLEYRTVTIHGYFDYTNEVALHSQVYENRIGVHLLTPFRLSDTNHAIVIDRGWIPLEEYSAGNSAQYQETGEVTLQGRLLQSVETGTIWRKVDPTPAPGERLSSLIYPNISRIAAQSVYPLPPVYVQASPSPDHTGLPYRTVEEIVLSEGSHMSYALQWFAFTFILLVGYPLYVRRTESGRLRSPKNAAQQMPASPKEANHEA